MAGTDTQKQLLSLIRDFASEKTQGEWRVVRLKKQIEELGSELEATNVELEDAKQFKEATEQELKGYEVELALNESTIKALEARISSIQDEVSAVGNEVAVLKKEEGSLRDRFIGQMFDLNKEIRKFQKTVASGFGKDDSTEKTGEAGNKVFEVGVGIASRTLEDMLADIVSQTAKQEEEYLEEQNIQKQVQLELADFERKIFLMEMIMKESKALQDLTRQTSELEQTCASLGEELQRRCVCPSCHLENVEALGGILQ